MSQPAPERSAPPFLTQHENWLDQAIAKARSEGAFDDLPNTGKPLKLDNLSVDSEYDLAFTMLKNAGASPYWMEMQKDGDAIRAQMKSLIERTAAFITGVIADAPVAEPEPLTEQRSIWNRIFGRHEISPAQPSVRFDRSDLVRARNRARAEYLERAAELDTQLVKYHQSLPSNLWHLQRYRPSMEEYAEEFDRAIPVIDTNFTQTPLT